MTKNDNIEDIEPMEDLSKEHIYTIIQNFLSSNIQGIKDTDKNNIQTTRRYIVVFRMPIYKRK